MIRRAREDGAASDEWLGRARESLWPRVAKRFVHRPEVEYPIVATARSEAGGQ